MNKVYTISDDIELNKLKDGSNKFRNLIRFLCFSHKLVTNFEYFSDSCFRPVNLVHPSFFDVLKIPHTWNHVL